ncbi:3D domain-containing protein [Sporolactobacillus sp. THM19-2]|uniref:3D domain-containing protein n=1 Tax=Sporolactobacillus sp. THM19-2 TaxID=2511171 RepID=UPI001020D9BA|nr:3D domain-containing protein [Sporolactobacillus sp. THM19-2]RYL88144.1 hypothetical protein EWH91_11905 [Sporolactobacillus sp. THM19-2]
MRRNRMKKMAAIMLATGLVLPVTAGSTPAHAEQPAEKSNPVVPDEHKSYDSGALSEEVNGLWKEKATRWEQYNAKRAAAARAEEKKAEEQKAQQTVHKAEPAQQVRVNESKPKVNKSQSQVNKPAARPAAQPVQKKSAAQPVQKKPAAQPVQKKPVAQPVQKKPVAQPAQKEQAAQPVQKKPVAQPVQKKPVVHQEATQPQATAQTSQDKTKQTKAAPSQPAVKKAPQSSKPATRPVQKQTQPAARQVQQSQPTKQPVQRGQSGSFEVTGYALNGTTATGINLKENPNARVVAVDPSVIPLGSKVTISGLGTYTAADTGGAIKGNRLDVHFATNQQAINFGRQTRNVTVEH